jgi:hypothetical protein
MREIALATAAQVRTWREMRPTDHDSHDFTRRLRGNKKYKKVLFNNDSLRYDGSMATQTDLGAWRRAMVLAAMGWSLAGVGCDAESPDEASFRCRGGGISGLVGLDRVDISGTPSVTGVAASVFSNVAVSLAGNYDLEGDAVSGGLVGVSGNRRPGGSVIEYAATIQVDDPTAAVLAAKTHNDNAKIPCLQKGNNCVSPLTGATLSLSSQQSLTLKSGTYYLEGISINGQARLNVNGAVVIYLAGGATFNGGSATNPSSDSLTVISSSPGDIKLNGGGTTDMHIFAPKAAVRFAGTQGFRGTALGKTLHISGTADLDVTSSIAVIDGYADCDSEDGDDGPSSPPPPPV